MRVLITGATGLIGGAVADAAVEAGHTVHALAHSAATAEQLRARGLKPVAGDLAQPASLLAAAAGVDAVIHAGFTGAADAAAIDQRAAETFAEALAGSGRPFIYTSGVWVLGPTGDAVADEDSPLAPIELVSWRGPLERWLRDAASRGTHAVILRPGVVHAPRGGIPASIANGSLPLVDGGTQRWPVVHVEDLARLYCAALERAAPGSVLHGITEVVRVADLIAAQPDARSELLHADLATARESLGAFADALALDQVVSADRTRAAMGWEPLHRVEAALLTSVAHAGP
jgi:nucleoside-diphosphate-sugar epimerase